MIRGPSLEYYVGIVRKHWIQILLIALVVLVVGYIYQTRQVPAYRASAKLKIIRDQVRRTGEQAPFTFEENQVFYNTQYNLLKTQYDWADQVLDKVARLLTVSLDLEGMEDPGGVAREQLVDADGLQFLALVDGVEDRVLEDRTPEFIEAADAVRREVVLGLWSLTEDSFLAGVTAAPIPNTYLAELSFEAREPGVAVFFANLYADLYREVTHQERYDEVKDRLGPLKAELTSLGEGLTDLEERLKEARDAIPTDYAHLDLNQRINPHQTEAEAYASKLNDLRAEQVLREVDEKHVDNVLTSAGITKFEPKDDAITLALDANGEGADDLHSYLSGESEILGLSIVESNESVRLERMRLRTSAEALTRVRERHLPHTLEYKRAEAEVETAALDIGREVAATIIRYLDEGRRLARKVDELQTRLTQAQKLAGVLNEHYSTLTDLETLIAAREREIERIEGQRDILSAAVSEDPVAGPLTIENIAIERYARLQDAKRIRPNTTMIFLLTIVAALFLSFGSAFLVEVLDDTVKTKEDFERLVGVPDIGYIPRISEKEFERKDTAVLEKPYSGVAEAFRSVRTGILFSKRDREIQTFLITSAGPGEGKTTVAVNLALTMAQAGRGKVLLIDADLRRARVHLALGVENTQGLTNCLVGSATLEDAVQQTEIEQLVVLSSGPTPPNPSELLGGHRMLEILEQAKGTYGKVILDTPPLVAVTDTSLLAPHVEGIFLVISSGKTSWRLISRGKDALGAVGVETTGAIVNNIRASSRRYGYGYGADFGKGYGYAPEGANEES